ncbi:hypothetical protein [uncultured Vagococcus sp.]|uniref:hypothetical protein n=1 Tax=uncultured Vagococcus sp. TaxID=189676 RepID=UPI0028D62E4A|nr:hypothetical protein [uncultured Vagococcus sp.]
MTYPVEQLELKKELSAALSAHTQLLRNVEHIEPEQMDAFTFMMRSFGFIFERVPGILLDNDAEETYFGIFQYYNLLAELKHNLMMSFPYAHLQNVNFSDILAPFPTQYVAEVNQWWEEKTGLVVGSTKQTMTM